MQPIAESEFTLFVDTFKQCHSFCWEDPPVIVGLSFTLNETVTQILTF